MTRPSGSSPVAIPTMTSAQVDDLRVTQSRVIRSEWLKMRMLRVHLADARCSHRVDGRNRHHHLLDHGQRLDPSALSIGIGAILRNVAGAIAAFVGIMLVLPVASALPQTWGNRVNKWLPSNRPSPAFGRLGQHPAITLARFHRLQHLRHHCENRRSGPV